MVAGAVSGVGDKRGGMAQWISHQSVTTETACNREQQKIILIKQVQEDLNEFVILTLFNEPTLLNPLCEMTTYRNNYFTGIIGKGHFES